MGFFSRSRIIAAVDQSKIKINYGELVVANVLLVLGGLVLGYGSARSDVIGVALAIIGGVLLFAGIVMTIRSFVAVVKALRIAADAVLKVTEYVEDVEKKTFGSSTDRFHTYDSLQKQVERLQKDVHYLVQLLKEKGFKIYGM